MTSANARPIALTPDSAGITTVRIHAGRYAIRSVAIGYVARYDTLIVRGGYADTLQLDMRKDLICLTWRTTSAVLVITAVT